MPTVLPRVIIAATAVLLASSSPSQSRRMFAPSYRELLAKSDVVVIATPLTKTADTPERAFLPGIFRADASDRQSRVESIGVETTFKVAAVLRGDQNLGQVVLHHYREASPRAELDGPFLVSFDPSDRATRRSYLLFLVREADGRFAPAGGQTDPGFKSIDPLPVE